VVASAVEGSQNAKAAEELSQNSRQAEYKGVLALVSHSGAGEAGASHPRAGDAGASDAELLGRTVSDPEAFGQFYDRFEREVLGFFYRATRRAEIAADLTAEVFAAALESVGAFNPQLGSARGWLFGIARHELADAWERGRVEDRARRRLAIEPLALTDEMLERIEQLGSERSVTAVQLLAELPDDQRLAIAGRVLEERDYAELAASLSCSESVVRQRVSRGLRALKKRLEQTG
jgi:RNA polymerase sigma-70 factor (ECF subfamily)